MVEKALSRSSEITLIEMAETLGVRRSALQRWITQSKNQPLETSQSAKPTMTNQEKRPQDWKSEDRLKLIIESDGLSDEAISELCSVRGIFPHYIQEWKQQMLTGTVLSTEAKKQVSIKTLRNEIKALNQDLNRKNKALAETAALLALQKKVNAIWGKLRGQLTMKEDRKEIMTLIEEAITAGSSNQNPFRS